MDLRNKSGAAALNTQSFPLLQVLVRPGDSVFLARYKVGAHHGMLEATYQSDQSLKVEFSGGTVETTCDGQLISVRGLLEGVPSAPVNAQDVAAGCQIHCAGDIARWFDGLVMENEHELTSLCNNFARRNPDSWVAVGMVNTARDLYSVVAHQGQAFVDTLRLGEGCYEGGWGIGKDALRALNFLPAFKNVRPLANRISALRGTNRVAPAVETAAAEAGLVRPTAEIGRRPFAPVPAPMPMPRPPAPVAPRVAPSLPGPLAKDPGGGVCWAVATVNAMQVLRGKFWMPVGKLFERLHGDNFWAMKALNPELLGTWLHEVKTFLQSFGVFMCELNGVRRLATKGHEVFDLMKHTPAGTVVVFSVQWVMKTGGKTKSAAHALVAWKDPAGTVYLIDRESEATGKIFRSFAELDTLGYTGITDCVIQEAYCLENCTGGFVQQGAKLLFAIGFTTTLGVQALEAQKPAQQR
ncbi:hypothetical protein D3874_25515 [Oleomonas cavernae]|uniref:Uncharacterized protein n=1 Tax=Oleomonas cavernae TaxID=2320859 RepID=A0A418VTL9_9PROT|nr:hypothetical protein D3874_25515 [Oleomonas cavernae]